MWRIRLTCLGLLKYETSKRHLLLLLMQRTSAPSSIPRSLALPPSNLSTCYQMRIYGRTHMTSSDSRSGQVIVPSTYVCSAALNLISPHRNSQQPDPRLDCAVLRPVESDGDHFLAYYLTKEDEPAIAFRSRRLQGDASMASDEVRETPSLAFASLLILFAGDRVLLGARL
jgi:hypothetical protein